MKIVFFHYSYPGIGGTETVTSSLARCFISRGNDVYILAWQQLGDGIDDSLFKTTYLPDRSRLNSVNNESFIYDYLSSNQIDCLINQGPFWTPTEKFKSLQTAIISVLHYAPNYKIVNQENAIVEIFKERSPSVIHSVKSTIRYCFKKYFARQDFNRLYKPDLHRTIINSDRFVLLCDAYIDQMKQLMQREYGNLVAISNGLEIIDATVFDKSKTVVSIGRLTKWDKRVDRLLRIWKSIENDHDDWNLQILGDGPERHDLEMLARKLGLKHCEFLGFVDIKSYLSSASILAMTSSSEGFPMVILEAQAYGVVPIAFDVSLGIHELIDDGESGIMIRPFDCKEYILRLSDLMIDADKRHTMAEYGHKHASRFNIDLIADRWIELINKVKHEKTKGLGNHSCI